MEKLFKYRQTNKLCISILFLTVSCSNHQNGTIVDLEKFSHSIVSEDTILDYDNYSCPVDGANLLVRCKDGRSKIFGIGYVENDLIINKGIILRDDAQEFCNKNVGEIGLRFKNCHFSIKARKSDNIDITYPWDTASRRVCVNSSR